MGSDIHSFRAHRIIFTLHVFIMSMFDLHHSVQTLVVYLSTHANSIVNASSRCESNSRNWSMRVVKEFLLKNLLLNVFNCKILIER